MNVALLGFGTVGKGAYDAAKRAGIVVKRVLVRSPRTGMEDIVTNDFSDILDDPEIDAVAEAIGGLHPAYEYAMAAMEAKKHFITANKALVCAYYGELARAAQKNGVQLRCTAAVGGGIQWLPNLSRAGRADDILELSGIMNGTTNFMLTGMSAGKTYAQVLSEAQIRGYAEADPTDDVMGYDARRKCAISAAVAFDTVIHEQDVLCEGISEISQDFIGRLCTALGEGTVKLIASAGLDEGGIYAAVQPEYIPGGALAFGVNGCYNMISYRGRNIGVQSYYGSGAGSGPTGTGMIQDIMDIVEGGGNRISVPGNRIAVDNCKKRRYYIETDGRQELTGPVSVKDMFTRISMEREKGIKAAFAALPDEVDG